MPNHYFQFKQFIVQQEKCSMKVCTDACILGVWAAMIINSENISANRILDIGTGTGLLSLMLAQKKSSPIEAIELDENAFIQATENCKNSPWSERLKVFHADAKFFISWEKYDFIICNPPFFQDDLLSAQKNKNIAKHDQGLRLDELIIAIKNNLNSDGIFAVLLPWHRVDYFKKLAAANNFYPAEELRIRQTLQHDFFRAAILFSTKNQPQKIKELVIKDTTGYSADFIFLMKDYYLNL